MRLWLFKALYAVLNDKVYSNLYLKTHLQQLPEEKRGLATMIFYGTLQNYPYLCSIWSQYVKKKPNLKVSIILSMSVYQMLFVEKTPDYAVINEAVRLTKKVQPSSSGFVNAVLRKIDAEQIPHFDDPIEQAAFENSLPLWLVQMWARQYSKEQALEMAQNSNQSLPVIVRANWLKSTPQEMQASADFVRRPDGLYEMRAGTLARHPMYREGKVSVQDEGSYQIAALMDPQPGMQILDVCAAPGTKTMAMAEMMQNKGSITALDLHAHRVALIEQDAARLGIDIVKAEQRDSTDLSGLGQFDEILCDVPCTGYGILSRKPDLKLKIQPEDMDSLIPLQKQLLEEAAGHVKDHGILVYSTCTINKKENEKQVETFLADHPEFLLETQSTLFPQPGKDGFYMARLKKNGGSQQICYNQDSGDKK